MRVELTYFSPRGDFVKRVGLELPADEVEHVWEDIAIKRRIGQLPGLRPNSGRDHIVHVLAMGIEHLVMPPHVDDDDVTPVRIPTGEMLPIKKPDDEER